MKESDRPLFYGAGPETFETARYLRKKMTRAEILLWEHLKGNNFCGLKFRRQHPISFYIADFYCHSLKLVIELDGKIHINKKDHDDGRTAEMENFGILVIRFKNEQVEKNIELVLSKLKKIVEKRQNETDFHKI